VSIELARKALIHLTENRREYNPGVWITAEQTDLAGRIALDAGAEPLFDPPGRASTHLAWYAGARWTIPDLARHLLGITAAEATALFGPRNTLRDLHRKVELIERDRLITDQAGRPMVACEETWRRRGSVPVIWRHRRTTVLLHQARHEVTHHASREQAHDYATDIAACRILTYTHDTSIWENPT
jgi:hypothetical protein